VSGRSAMWYMQVNTCLIIGKQSLACQAFMNEATSLLESKRKSASKLRLPLYLSRRCTRAFPLLLDSSCSLVNGKEPFVWRQESNSRDRASRPAVGSEPGTCCRATGSQ
jgi:hypothetical protein